MSAELMSLFPEIVFREYYVLWLLFFIAPLVFFIYWRKYIAVKKKLYEPWFAMHLENTCMPACASMPRKAEYVKKAVVLFMIATLLVFAAMGAERKTITRVSIYGNMRIAFLLDVSDSMRYAHDILPNRLDGAKQVIKELTDVLWHDPAVNGRYLLSLIPFSGKAIPLYLPFTHERENFLELLEQADENTINDSGTSLFEAVSAYKKLLEKYPQDGEDVIDLAIVISDGGKETGVSGDRDAIARLIRNLPRNVVINTVGIGSKKIDETCRREFSALLPEASRKDIETRVLNVCYKTQPVALLKKNRQGAIVGYLREDEENPASTVLTSELDEAILSFLATTDARNGVYVFFKNTEKLVSSLRQVVLKHRRVTEVRNIENFEPILEWFLIPALMLLYFIYLDGWKFPVRLYNALKKNIILKSAG